MVKVLLNEERGEEQVRFTYPLRKNGKKTRSGSERGPERGQAHLLDAVRFAWLIRGSDACEALGLGLDHGAEVVPTPGALLLEVCTDLL